MIEIMLLVFVNDRDGDGDGDGDHLYHCDDYNDRDGDSDSDWDKQWNALNAREPEKVWEKWTRSTREKYSEEESTSEKVQLAHSSILHWGVFSW